jgi:Na+/H+ antiporter NhaA
MGVFGVFAGKFPAAVSAFLLTLATVDDLGAIAVIATCFAKHVQTGYLAAAAGVQVQSKRLATRSDFFSVSCSVSSVAVGPSGICCLCITFDTCFCVRRRHRRGSCCT